MLTNGSYSESDHLWMVEIDIPPAPVAQGRDQSRCHWRCTRINATCVVIRHTISPLHALTQVAFDYCVLTHTIMPCMQWVAVRSSDSCVALDN